MTWLSVMAVGTVQAVAAASPPGMHGGPMGSPAAPVWRERGNHPVRMEIGLSQRLQQTQILSPQMIQSMEILVLNAQQLEDRIDQELEENVALEVQDPSAGDLSAEASASDSGVDQAADRSLGSVDGASQEGTSQASEGESAEDREIDLLRDRYEHLAEYQASEFQNAPGRLSTLPTDEDEDRFDVLMNTPDHPESLQDHLLQQISLKASLSPRERQLCLEIVYNLDGRGYLLYPIEEIHAALNGSSATLPEGDSGAELPVTAGSPEAPGDPAALESASEPLPDSEESAPSIEPFLANGTGGEPTEPLPVEAATSPPVDDTSDTEAGEDPSVDENDAFRGKADEGDDYDLPVALPVGLEELQAALGIVRSLDPAGVAADDLRSCLLLQLERDPEEYPLEIAMIQDHLKDIARNRIPQIAKALKTSIDKVKDSIEIIASLNPIPGRAFSNPENSYVRPDVLVYEEEGKFKVQVENQSIPRLRISPYYRNLLELSKKDPEIRKYIKKKIDNAEWLLHAIQQRKSTLARVAEEVVEYQEDFFRRGSRFLKPLKMQQIADKIGVNVSTVSRAISGKYFQAPGAIKELKFLFTGGTVRDDGTLESRGSVIQRIRDLIADENKKKPLSDSKIVKLLEEDGIKISRRTVTKYREAESIPSSRERREY